MILGFVTSKDLLNWQNAPASLPHFQFYERHCAIIRTTCPEKILPVIARFDIQQDVVVKTLMSVRQLPQRLRQKSVTPFGLHSFTLLENTATELCYGLRGQFWRADFGLEDIPDGRAYGTPLKSGNAKLLLRYQVRQLAGDRYELCTETFIHCPDRATRLKMAGYWLAIRMGSGWIRQRTLKAVKRELEKAG
ncbi:hypothetical protein EDF81_0720 [Enterobacter sp. BIGb0383]|uniref:hypothetical protein n=1 Tax=unclassified Enterobacter TaxID=2608935 RepID=UPI000F467BD9|nr:MULTISPECIES: hypothetical protein [unclassified Enterobacter]ROP62237.1 hypothetical protein EDF81_0720 [Enterobacter sp. BIGb0383]ROS12398.1 hypothetical protein EC848_0722 [Enterobacter sp. BIGb0359]